MKINSFSEISRELRALIKSVYNVNLGNSAILYVKTLIFNLILFSVATKNG